MTAPFISADDLGTYMGQDLSASDLATVVCDAACQLIRDEIDQVVNYVSSDEVILQGRQRDLLIVPEVPIVAVASVTIDDGDPLVEDTDFRVVNERTMIQRLSDGAADSDVVWETDTWITVSYSHGWVVDENQVDLPNGLEHVPSSIRMVALSLAAAGMVAGRTGVGGVKSETLGRYRYDLDTTNSSAGGMILSPEQCDALYRYRVEGVA